MLTIVQRGGSTREKPPEVVRGQSCRLPWAWDGLCFGVPFNDATRDSARDLVTNAAPSAWINTPSWTKDNRGNNAALMSSGAYVEYANNPAHDRPTTAITVYARIRRAGTPALPASGLFAKIINMNAMFDTWWMGATDADATKLSAALTVDGTDYYWENSSYITDTSTWLSLFLRWSSGTVPVQDVLGERGQSYSTAAYTGAVSGTLTYAVPAQPIRVNVGELLETGTYAAAYSQLMLWSRRLTDAELQALVADPYGWYSPRRETIGLSSPYPLAFGGGEMRQAAMIGGLP